MVLVLVTKVLSWQLTGTFLWLVGEGSNPDADKIDTWDTIPLRSIREYDSDLQDQKQLRSQTQS